MAEIQSIRQALIPLIDHRFVPLDMVATIGEIIILDARFQNQPLRDSLEQLGERLEAYDAILQQAKLATNEFLQHRNTESLKDAVLAVKERLAALG